MGGSCAYRPTRMRGRAVSLSPLKESEPIRLTPKHLTAVLALTAVLLASSCTAPEAMRWLAHRGDRQAQVDHHAHHAGQPVDLARYERLAEVATVVVFLLVWRAHLDAEADWHARHSGAPGTCTETGIFYAESGGNWTALNGSSSASGGFQFLDSTWAGHRGYARAVDAPPWVQHERFHQTWAGGAGRGHWAASVC